ncbi:MAG TPA: NeuD/PglB/VioB family sugar acetyltransferase [Solirubrobacteraceae bacterium]|nr:NeuD/PglB/VioB family sugar acetyltransferase [Solirubrobacteraceae bacterium]
MLVALVGSRADGHARVVLETLLDCSEFEVAGLLDDVSGNKGNSIGPYSVIGSTADLPRLAGQGISAAVLGFGAARGRLRVAEAARAAALKLPILRHSSAVVERDVVVGEGSQMLAMSYLGPGVRVGSACLVNTRATLEHDVYLGDGSVAGPGAILAGRVRIGLEVEIGAGAVVLPDVSVGDGAVVGAGAVVTANVVAGAIVAGVPARAVGRSSRCDVDQML